MSHRFVRCPHCRLPHDAAERVCPTTGRPLPGEAAARSRMSELPPPERRPEPLSFDPTNRIANTRAGRGARESEGTGSIPPTRDPKGDLIGRTIGGRYRVRGVLGEGGMGMVYDAEHTGLGREVAIKVLNPNQAKKRVAVKRFQQEARAAGAIGHPNICEVYDLGQLDDGSPYLVMEKLVGTTLADRITREGGLPFDEIVDVMMQVMGGLIAAHDKGIVHRDIKPENIFLARRVGSPPIAKILDFGVSKMMPQFQSSGDEQLDLTRTGMVMGTPYYMSPEQARGERNLDGRVDVYACGVMMYETIVGKRPFLAPNYNALLLAIINSTPKLVREARPATPPALEAIVVRAMRKARDDRYPSASHMLHDLQAYAAAAAQAALASGTARMPPPPTAEERKRAQVLGGGRARTGETHVPASKRGQRIPAARAAGGAGGAGAMLHRSMTGDEPASSKSYDPSTRIDIRGRQPVAARADSDSIEIPIHITGSDLKSLEVDDPPTAVFRPDMHHHAPRQASHNYDSVSATKLSAQPQQAYPQPRPAAGRPAVPVHTHVPAPAPAPAPAPLAPAPVDISGLAGDDWDAATVVKKPAALTRPRRDATPFNPDETVALAGNEIDVDVDFSADETIGPTPRRR